MQADQLIANWRLEEVRPFSGWDFSYLDGRMIEDQPPWSYSSRAADLMRQAASVLDMGTGGGERLLELKEFWPGKVVATEDYPPNIKLAAERLSIFGVQVVDVKLSDTGPLPFSSNEFDLVLNRHSGLNAQDVARILAPAGTFLTQQIHGLWAADLLAAFHAQPAWPDSTLQKYVPQLESAGLTITAARDWSGRLSFTDVGAIVYYLRAVPWLVPGFSVETHSKCLLALQAQLDSGADLTFTARKYLVEAHKKTRSA